jgi:hypothetical protein
METEIWSVPTKVPKWNHLPALIQQRVNQPSKQPPVFAKRGISYPAKTGEWQLPDKSVAGRQLAD